MSRLKKDNETLRLRVEQLDHDKKNLETDKKQYIEQITTLREDLAFYSRNNDVQESIKRIEQLRREKEERDKKIQSLLQQINELSNHMDDMTAENR